MWNVNCVQVRKHVRKVMCTINRIIGSVIDLILYNFFLNS